MLIRKAGLDDAGQLLSLINDIGWFSDYLSPDVEQNKKNISNSLNLHLSNASHSTLVSEDENKLIHGYIAVHWLPYLFLPGSEGFISELFVKSESRGKNIGTDLLNRIIIEAKDRGCYRLSLLNGRDHEAYQRKFYVKNGFVERDRIANFILKL